MSLTVQVDLKEFVVQHGLDSVLTEAYWCKIAKKPKPVSEMVWQKKVMREIAEWCAETIDADIMMEAYKDE